MHLYKKMLKSKWLNLNLKTTLVLHIFENYNENCKKMFNYIACTFLKG